MIKRRINKPSFSNLSSLFAHDADAQVGLLNHGNVIGAISDRGTNRLPGKTFGHAHDFSLVQRRHATTQHGLASARDIGEPRHPASLLQQIQRLAIDDERMAGETVRTGGRKGLVQLLQLFVEFHRVDHVRQLMHAHGPVEMAATVGDVDGGGLFVAGEHPDADAGAVETDQRVLDAVLEEIFDAGGADHGEIGLDGGVHGRQFGLAVFQGVLRGDQASIEIGVFRVVEDPLPENESSKALGGERLQMTVSFLFGTGNDLGLQRRLSACCWGKDGEEGK